MKKLKKVLIIGSGPVVIGQAAEFDYSGTQACLAVKDEGIITILVNSNPATIQTDSEIADVVYVEPLTISFLEKIIAREKPDGLIATMGGQTALNLATELFQKGILEKYDLPLLGTGIKTIKLAEDRNEFKKLMQKIFQPTLPSKSVKSVSEAINFASKLGFPLIIRADFTLGGTGSSIVLNQSDLQEKIENGLNASLTKEVLVEKSVLGWAEIEYEIIRDSIGNKIMICNMENLDPMGIHTGESIVVTPSQTLSDDDYQKLRSAAFSIVDALNIQGGCNIQFALNQKTGEFFVIEVNPRLSRSSALASKATGYPIARVATKIALGKSLPEIINPITGKTAFFEPALDYVVIKIPKWPDDKFPDMDKRIGITMKSTGEVMAIGRNFEEAMYKAIQSLDLKESIFEKFSNFPKKEVFKLLKNPNTQRLSAIFAAFHQGMTSEEISNITHINPWFISKLKKLYEQKKEIVSKINVYKMVDTCAGEFEALTPYYYSTYGSENEAKPLVGPKVVILGSGPIKIGQGIEFDYLTVHAVLALKEKGIKSIIINNNPETVSTDFSISDRLYFEPLTPEFVLKVIENEKEGLLGVIPQFGGQTAINLVEPLASADIKILGTSPLSIDLAEDREKAANIVQNAGYQVPAWYTVNNKDELLGKAKKLGLPVLIRPSFVLAGEGMIIAQSEKDISNYLKLLGDQVFDKPVLIDKFLKDSIELDIDFVSDGETTISFILEQLDSTGTHSGDSSCVFPSQKIDPSLQKKIKFMTENISKAFGIIGLANIQCAVKNNEIYVLEINPRGSRTVPFISKCIGVSLAKLATNVILGEKLPGALSIRNGIVALKTPVFSFEKLPGVSTTLGPLMKSTGEIMSIGKDYNEASNKAHNTLRDYNDINVYPLQG